MDCAATQYVAKGQWTTLDHLAFKEEFDDQLAAVQ
jgi:hypothetical protein